MKLFILNSTHLAYGLGTLFFLIALPYCWQRSGALFTAGLILVAACGMGWHGYVRLAQEEAGQRTQRRIASYN